ncbi:hypothetical protein SM124_19945 [Bacillus sp. 31A1R]|uniref:Uncharacterized protein n=1 Tax=Robertmurraya mangrovi TaxID=3098077 RepID=A0ABU5J3L4_9BACI|nr:hypothetical protein [Bacillus sp. 31A1R]MDZ5473997.1 hypothetical protein [Bacillus sp. 31A1R]
MNNLYFLIGILLFFLTMILFSSQFYIFATRNYTKAVSKRLGFKVKELHYSLDQIIYFISLPSNLPEVRNAKIEDLVIEQDYSCYLFPKLKGIKIWIHSNKNRLELGYLPIENFRLPSLDKWENEGKISDETNFKISICKLIHPKTIKEIREEVFKQIQIGRYEIS